jgi:hypothetical protein
MSGEQRLNKYRRDINKIEIYELPVGDGKTPKGFLCELEAQGEWYVEDEARKFILSPSSGCKKG